MDAIHTTPNFNLGLGRGVGGLGSCLFPILSPVYMWYNHPITTACNHEATSKRGEVFKMYFLLLLTIGLVMKLLVVWAMMVLRWLSAVESKTMLMKPAKNFKMKDSMCSAWSVMSAKMMIAKI